jgi:DNA replication protein DnaC
VNRLFKEIEVAEASGTYLNYLAKLNRAKILILDDFGLRNYSHEEANIIYDILEERYQKGSTIITSQVKPQGWKILFEDEVIGEAIIDRLTACAHIIDVTGDSFRNNHSPKKDVRNEDRCTMIKFRINFDCTEDYQQQISVIKIKNRCTWTDLH